MVAGNSVVDQNAEEDVAVDAVVDVEMDVAEDVESIADLEQAGVGALEGEVVDANDAKAVSAPSSLPSATHYPPGHSAFHNLDSSQAPRRLVQVASTDRV